MNKTQKIVQQAHLEEEKRILRQLKLVYGQAQDDCINKIIDLSRRRDMENLQSVIYQKQYQEVLKKQLDGLLDNLQGEEFTSISEYLEKCYHNGYIGTMYDIHSQGIPIIMPINQEQVVQALRTDSKLSKSLYDSLGEDVNYLKKSIRAELSRGTANGSTWNEMAEKIAKGMNSPFKKAYNRAVVISRTEGHRIQQKSALDAQYAAKEKGADIVKQWDATLDNRTRPHHRRLDGQLRELEEPFELEGMTAMAPGYFGKPKEDCNCRCCLLQRARWVLDEEELEELKKRATYFGLDKTKNFEAFKKKYMEVADNIDMFDILDNSEYTNEEKIYTPEKLIRMSKQINSLLNTLVQPRSKWSGKTFIKDKKDLPKAKGVKKATCDIWLREDVGIKTIIHEHLHARSSSWEEKHLKKAKGFEEGACELLAEEICKRYNIPYKKTYKKYVDPLKDIRKMLSGYESDYDFAIDLFNVDMHQREEWLNDLAKEEELIDSLKIKALVRKIRRGNGE